jgi:hypothetical protein
MMRALVWIAVAGCMDYNPGAPVGPPSPEDVPDGSILEEFDGGGSSSVDVIVFGDTSGSMAEELRTLGDAIQPFVDRLATHVDDWQLAAVTGDSGCTVSGILTPETPDYARKFADAIVQPAGSDDSAEMGLQNVALVMEDDRGCNEGLVRGGMLEIVFVSDENEESPGYDERPDYWRDWVDRIGAAHGDPSRIKMSAVGGPTPNGCPGADPGFGYDHVVSATGGQFVSICGDWADQLEIVADQVALRDTFPLAHEPVPESLQVWVDQLPVAFTYDAAANAVHLADPIGADDTVSVLYELQ